MRKFEVSTECAVLMRLQTTVVEALNEDEAVQKTRELVGRFDSIKKVVEIKDLPKTKKD